MERYEHQERAFNFALSNIRQRKNAALFMDPGTGKTRVTLDVFSELYKEGIDGMVVLYPKGLLTVWVDEIKKWVDDYVVWVYDAQKKDTKKNRSDFEFCLNSKRKAFFLFNIEAFQVPNKQLEMFLLAILKQKKPLLVLDESSYIKTIKAKRTKNIITLSGDDKFLGKMILTGTEVTKSLLDLYTQFEFLNKNFWGMNYYMFRAKYAVVEARSFYKRTPYGIKKQEFKEVIGYKNVDDLLKKISGYYIRISKDDCLDLPEKIQINVPIQLDATSTAFYEKLKKQMMLEAKAGDEKVFVHVVNNLFMKLRQITGGFLIDDTGNAKKICEENMKMGYLVSDVSGHDKQAIIWAVFRHEIEYITEKLSKIDHTVCFYGDVSEDERTKAIHSFQNGEARFLVANPYACGFGVNLQNAHMMYYYSMPLSPEVLLQSQDRIHRAGQKEKCVYKYLLAANTVDYRIRELQDIRAQLREAFIKKRVDILEKIL